MTSTDDASTNDPKSEAVLPDPDPMKSPPVDNEDVNVSLRPSRRRLWIALLVGCVVAGAWYGISYFRGRPDPIRKIFVEQIPDWQLRRGRGWIPAGGMELAAMQSTLRRHPQVTAALGRLDAAFPDAEAVRKAGHELSDALFASRLPYYLDPQLIQKQTILLSYSVVGESTWRASSQSIFVRRLSRLDHINVEMGLFGQTEKGRPVVFLDRIEASLIKDLLDAAGKRKPTPRLRPLTDADQAALYEIRRVFTTRVGEAALDSLVTSLLTRDAAFEAMRGRLHDGKLEIDTPETFAYGEAWFERLWPRTSLQNPGGPLILDTDLRAVEVADAKLRTPEATNTINALLDVMALGTEAHETRHAIDDGDAPAPPVDAGPEPTRPVPDALAEIVGTDPQFAANANGELRAHLGELYDAPSAPCISIAQGIRKVAGRYIRRTPHFFANYLILTRLGGDAELADPVALVHRLCAEPEPALRARVAALWKELYGSDLVPARRG